MQVINEEKKQKLNEKRRLSRLKKYQDEFNSQFIRDECMICFETKKLYTLCNQCKHKFCNDCYKNQLQSNCANCRNPIVINKGLDIREFFNPDFYK
jgi:hypothetical protein